MIKIESMRLENFRGFTDTTIQFSKNVTCIAGVNGAGKSTILEAGKLVLSWIANQIVPKKVKDQNIAETDVADKIKKSSISANIRISESPDVKTKITSKQVSKSNKGEHKSDSSWYFIERMPSSPGAENKSLPVLVYYPCNRSDLNIKLSVPGMSVDLSDKYKVYDNALSPVVKFDDFFMWFRDREDRENEIQLEKYKSDDAGKKYEDSYLKAVRQAIFGFLPNFDFLKVSRNANRIIAKKGNAEINLATLSDGEKGIIVLFGDIARRLAMANPNSENPLEGDGIILIDEIELHLHPEWQRRIVPALTKTFPNCQFIITTHSPQVLGEIEPENIRLLNNFEVTTPKQSYGLDSNSVLAFLQGSKTINEDVNTELELISKLTDEEKFDEARKRLEQLKEKLHGSTPDTLSAETAINVLEA